MSATDEHPCRTNRSNSWLLMQALDNWPEFLLRICLSRGATTCFVSFRRPCLYIRRRREDSSRCPACIGVSKVYRLPCWRDSCVCTLIRFFIPVSLRVSSRPPFLSVSSFLLPTSCAHLDPELSRLLLLFINLPCLLVYLFPTNRFFNRTLKVYQGGRTAGSN